MHHGSIADLSAQPDAHDRHSHSRLQRQGARLEALQKHSVLGRRLQPGRCWTLASGASMPSTLAWGSSRRVSGLGVSRLDGHL